MHFVSIYSCHHKTNIKSFLLYCDPMVIQQRNMLKISNDNIRYIKTWITQKLLTIYVYFLHLLSSEKIRVSVNTRIFYQWYLEFPDIKKGWATGLHFYSWSKLQCLRVSKIQRWLVLSKPLPIKVKLVKHIFMLKEYY